MPWPLRTLLYIALIVFSLPFCDGFLLFFCLLYIDLHADPVTPRHCALSFLYFTNFQPNINLIQFQGDAFSSDNILQLTKNHIDGTITNCVGRASYAEPVRVWDRKTGKLTDFTTHFTFIMKAAVPSQFGDGMSFFLLPFQSAIPNNSAGGYLGLFTPEFAFNNTNNSVVAVEFDSFNSTRDPASDHVGINVNSIVSVANVSWKSSMKQGKTGNAWTEYNPTQRI